MVDTPTPVPAASGDPSIKANYPGDGERINFRWHFGGPIAVHLRDNKTLTDTLLTQGKDYTIIDGAEYDLVQFVALPPPRGTTVVISKSNTPPAASERMTAEQRLKRLREFTTGERGPYTDLTNDIKAVLASLRLPQPDRAKADEGVDLHKVIATAFYEGCKRIWPKRRLPYKASLLSVAYADEVAPAIAGMAVVPVEALKKMLVAAYEQGDLARFARHNKFEVEYTGSLDYANRMIAALPPLASGGG